MKYVNLLVKPASSLCNMRCDYCFYADESNHRLQQSMGLMTEETAARLIDAAFSAADAQGAVSFSFQGGEPTLAGLSFFQRFVQLVQQRNTARLPVRWAIQTNGLLLNQDWANFLKENDFLVGVSIDGDRSAHDAFRHDASGQGTYDRITANLALLQKAGVDTNILCVVNGKTASSPKRTYRALKALGCGYLQFIPCLDPLEAPRGKMKWSLTPELYGQFLCGVFDEWYKDWRDGRYVSIRQFDDWVHLAMGQMPSACSSSGRCGGYLLSEADGSIYPCDFYALDEWKLGDLSDGLEALMQSEKMAAFLRRSQRKPIACTSCPCFPLCRGGCPRDWEGSGPDAHHYFCRTMKHTLNYAGARIMEIARAEQLAASRAATTTGKRG